MTKFSDNDSPSLLFTEQGSTPTTPAASHQRLFVRSSDHLLCFVNSSGTVTPVGSGLSDPMTTRGDIIVRNASNVTARLAIGSSGKVLSSDGTDVSWQTPSSGGLTQAYAGYNTVGGSNENCSSRIFLKKITLANDCLVTSVGAYIKQVSAGQVSSAGSGLMTDVAGTPTLFLGGQITTSGAYFLSTSNGAAGAARWFMLPVGIWAPAGDYWLVFYMGASSTYNIYYDGSGSDQTYVPTTDRLSDAGWTTVTTTSNKYSIRANTVR